MGKRRRSVALVDWDGTLRDGWTLPSWIDALATDEPGEARDPDHAPSKKFNALAARYVSRHITHDELVRRAEALYLDALRPHDLKSVQDLASDFVQTDRENMRPFAAHLLEQLDRRGLEVIVISGAPLIVLQCYRRFLPISQVWGLKVALDSTGWRLQSNTGLTDVKAAVVKQIARQHRIVASFGDSESDAPLLHAAEVPVVVGSLYNARGDVLRIGSDGAGYEEVVSQVREVLARPV